MGGIRAEQTAFRAKAPDPATASLSKEFTGGSTLRRPKSSSSSEKEMSDLPCKFVQLFTASRKESSASCTRHAHWERSHSETLACMRDGVRPINTARRVVVEERPLIDAVRTDEIECTWARRALRRHADLHNHEPDKPTLPN